MLSYATIITKIKGGSLNKKMTTKLREENIVIFKRVLSNY